MDNKRKKILTILGVSFGILIIAIASTFIVVNHNRKKAEEKARLEKQGEETVDNEKDNENINGSTMIPFADGAFIDEEPYNENPVVSNTQESKYLADRLGYKVGDKLDGLFTYKGEDIFVRDSDGIKFKITYDENNQIILTPVQNNNTTGNNGNSNSNSNSGNKKPSNNTGNNNSGNNSNNSNNNNNSSSNNDDGPTSGFIPEEDGWTDGSDDIDPDDNTDLGDDFQIGN